MSETTVLIVDDDPGFRASARRLLESEGYSVVGEAPDGESAVTSARHLSPQVALVDIYLPDIDGLEVASRLAALMPAPVIVLISNRDRAESAELISDCPARGFVPKDELSRAAIEELL